MTEMPMKPDAMVADALRRKLGGVGFDDLSGTGGVGGEVVRP